MKPFGVRVDGIMLLTLVGIAGGAYVYFNRNKFNPASEDNMVNQSDFVQNHIAKPDERGYSRADKVFALVDIMNPFNESDDYAEKVLDIEQKSLEDLRRERQVGQNPSLFVGF